MVGAAYRQVTRVFGRLLDAGHDQLSHVLPRDGIDAGVPRAYDKLAAPICDPPVYVVHHVSEVCCWPYRHPPDPGPCPSLAHVSVDTTR